MQFKIPFIAFASLFLIKARVSHAATINPDNFGINLGNSGSIITNFTQSLIGFEGAGGRPTPQSQSQSVNCTSAFPIPNQCGIQIKDCENSCTCSNDGKIQQCKPLVQGCTSQDIINQCTQVGKCVCSRN